jgi:hypothetical protein
MDRKHLEDMTEDIQTMRDIAERLHEKGKGIESIDRNMIRILSSIRLLELNVTDVVKIADALIG